MTRSDTTSPATRATITLNRPEALNALLAAHDPAEPRAAYEEVETNDDIWLMIVTGNGGRSAPAPT